MATTYLLRAKSSPEKRAEEFKKFLGQLKLSNPQAVYLKSFAFS